MDIREFIVRKIKLIAFSLCFCIISAVQADKIVIGSDEWCPFNCVPGSDKPGYMIEVATKIFSKAGHTLEYKIIPWARAITEARSGKINGIIGAYKGDAPDFVFSDNELAMIGIEFFTLKTNSWSYAGLASLNKVSIGAIIGYEYNEEINAYLKDGKNSAKVQMVAGDTPLETNIKKLSQKRLDAVIESPPVFWYTAAQMGLNDKIKSAGTAVKPKEAYIAFSPKLPSSKKYAKILSDGTAELRKSGELKTILEKYGLKDWK